MDRTEQARDYLCSQRGRLRALSKEAGLSYNWVMKFTQGHIQYPSARLIDRVLAYQASERVEA